MKLRNRILSIIMVLAMLVSSVAVFAEDTVAEDTVAEEVVVEDTKTAMPTSTEKLYGKLALLESLGFFEDMNALELDDAVTRATFASWLEKAANLTGEKPYQTTEFSDVAPEHDSYDAIQNVVAAGYMSGMGGSVFMPSAAITLTDVAASLVRLTGKEAYANLRGGYPTGYEVTARSIGLYDGVKTGVNTTVNVLVMMYNALRADYLAPEGLSNEGIIYMTGETVLSFFHNIYEVEGTMTANGFTKTYSDALISNPDSVEIDNLVYECNNSKLHDLIGRYVQGFYRLNKEEDTREMVSAYADENDNTIFELKSRANSSGGHNLRLVGLTLYYPIDNGAREKKIELKPGFDFIYNNRAVPTRLDSDILVPDGELTFIDKDNDKKYDIVIAKARVTEKVTGIDNYINAVYTETYSIQKGDYEDSILIIKKQDRKTGVISEVTVDEIPVGAVATIYRSLDGMYNEIITCEQSDFVTPTGVDEDDVVYVDEKVYEFANASVKADVVIGLSSEFYFDYLGRIAYIEKAANLDYSYGYVFKVWYNHEEEAEKIRMLTPYGEEDYAVHTKVMVDGVSGVQPQALETYVSLYSLVRFRLDSKGNIRSVDTENDVIHGCNHNGPNTCLSYDERHNKLTCNVKQSSVMYNGSGASFGAGAQYMKGRSTFALTAPTDATEKTDIKKYKTYLEDSDIGNRTLSIYDWDSEDTLEIGVVIHHVAGKVSTPSLDRYSVVGVAKKVYRIWDDGEDVLKIDLVQNGKDITLAIADTIPEFKAKEIGFGDVIAYELDADGKMAAVHVDLDAHETMPTRSVMDAFNRNSGDFRHEYGKILKRLSGYAIVQPNGTTNTSDRVTIPITTISDLTLVDMTQKTVSGIDKEYFSSHVGSSSSPSYVYAQTYKNSRCDELVVYKY